ncbi:uncharacterized protein DDB_G0283357-like [Teleopsis dalmanni]|uniref:uncharacterized protein DDB_G0283357-like n=1 Tax=Teleopsis dalmanni TaxID=139649 RepID=UPI0018CEAE99|nr:uncharacterized protein DDB_G0283357-like [Teleopsis dalmanni]
MSPDNPTQILTTHDLSNLRSLPSVTTASIAAATAVATTPITFGSNPNQNQNNHNNVVLSTIPLFIQQSPLVSTSATTLANNNNNNNNQQQRTISTNGLRTNTNINNLLAAAGTKATIVSTNNNHSSSTIKNGNNMPTTSKYVFLQQNGNGQFTTFEGTTTTVNNSNNTRSNNNNVVSNNNVGNIVLLATEPMELTGGSHTEQQHIITTSSGDNDEELRPLAWLNDTNLIKGIVATSATNIIGGAQQSNSVNNKRTLGSNICIVNASNAHDLIEELPQHVASEEQVATTTSTGNNQNDLSETQITTLSVSDFQQQFIASNKRFGLTCLPLSQQETISGAAPNAVTIKREQQSLYNNIPAIDATTTVHVGPSGTTTLVEYKSNASFMPAQRQLLSNNVGNNIVNNATTITATNLSITNNNNTTTNSNNYVPSSSNSTTTSSNTSHSPATSSLQTNKTVTLPNSILTANTSATNANSNIVANSNNTTNTVYQGQKQHSNGTTSTSTTHHPHKKYLREKMNVLDHGGGGGSTGTGLPSANGGISTITVSSPASSNNSMSSSASSTPSSTAAVNGDNSPISKSFFSLGNIGIAAMGNHFSNSSSHSVAASSPASSDVASVKSNVFTSNKATSFTIVNPAQHIVTSAMSSPEPPNSKDFFTLVTPQHHQQQQQQQQQAMRSPTSYSSYDNDSLKDFEICTSSPASSGARLTTSTPQQSHNNSQQHSTPKTTAHNNNSTTPQKQKHPNNVPYDPQVHTHNKPPYSFSSLIFMAIEGSNEKALPVKEIYAWIVQHFPYFKTAPTGWKNSVRHNLSLNKSFVKVEKAPNMGKGSLWRVEQQQRQNLIQALTRSPFFPNSAVDKIALKSPSSGIGINNTNSNDYDPVEEKSSNAHINPRFDPRLFPNLSKAFKDMSEHNVLNDVVSDVPDDDIPSDYSTTNNPNLNSKNSYNYTTSLQNGGSSIIGGFSNFENIERLARECGADSIDDVNAATAMLALKHGPKVFSETFQNGAPVITSSPSEDHTYSAGGSGASTPLTNGNTQSVMNGNTVRQNGCDNQSNCASSDAAYESSEENHNITPEELEDQQRHRDGVDALLSLSLSSVMDSPSSCSPIKRPSSTTVDEEHISSYMESAKKSPPQHHHVGKIALISNATTNTYNTNQLQTHHQNNNHNQQLQHHLIFNEGYNTQSYFSNNNNNNHNHHNIHHLSTSLPPKKLKPLRSLRTKIKRKAQWLR